MTKLAIIFCIALASSTGQSQVTQPSRNTISWWSRIRHPVQSIQKSINMKIDDILAVKRTNDRSSRDTRVLIDDLDVSIDAIAKAIKEVEATLNLESITKLVPPEKSAECTALFSSWKNRGTELRKGLSKCVDDAVAAVKNYDDSQRSIMEIIPKAENYRNQINSCTAYTGFLSPPKSLGCTLWVYFKWIFFSVNFTARMTLSTEAQKDLVRIYNQIIDREQCNGNSLAVRNFFIDGQDIAQRTHDCMMSKWSAHVSNKSNKRSVD